MPSRHARSPSPTFVQEVEEELARQLDALGTVRETLEQDPDDTHLDQTLTQPSLSTPNKQSSVGTGAGHVSTSDFLKSKTEQLSSVLNGTEITQRHEHNKMGIGSSRAINVGVSSAPAEESGSFNDGLAFPQKFVANMLSEAKKFGTLGSLATWVEESTMSSAFSGVGAPETAMMLLHREVQALLPDRKVLWLLWFQHS